MTKMLEATCVGGVVTAGGVPVAAADILSQGVQASVGVLLLEEDTAKYLTSNATDIKTTLEKIIALLTDLTAALTLIDAKPTGGAGSAVTPVAAANIVNLTALSAQLAILKEALK